MDIVSKLYHYFLSDDSKYEANFDTREIHLTGLIQCFRRYVLEKTNQYYQKRNVWKKMRGKALHEYLESLISFLFSDAEVESEKSVVLTSDNGFKFKVYYKPDAIVDGTVIEIKTAYLPKKLTEKDLAVFRDYVSVQTMGYCAFEGLHKAIALVWDLSSDSLMQFPLYYRRSALNNFIRTLANRGEDFFSRRFKINPLSEYECKKCPFRYTLCKQRQLWEYKRKGR